MMVSSPIAVLVWRCAKMGGAVHARSGRRRLGEEVVMASPIDLEPQAKAVVDANANPPYLFELGPEQGRRTIDAVQSGPVKKPTVDIEDTTVPGGPSGQVSVRILRPQGILRPLAVILYVHGAGWVFGNYHTHDRLIRELAVGAQAAVVFPNYSRSPEAKYPTAIQECYAVAKWVAEHGQERGLDPSRIAIAGDSVGGNMSAAATLLAKQRSGPAFRQQVLFYPVTVANFDTESYHQYATGYYKLRDAGVPVTVDRFPAIIHDFVMLNALADTNAARGAITLATDTLRTVLSDKP